LSLSAGKTRLTAHTNAEGLAKFSKLQPQKYYLTSILKEYAFDDAMTSVDVAHGEHAHTTLQATRMAFSAYGIVRTLTGRIVTDGKVIALSSAEGGSRQQSEEASLEHNGQFRLMGLLPGNTYTLSLSSPSYERILPAEISITIPEFSKEDAINPNL